MKNHVIWLAPNHFFFFIFFSAARTGKRKQRGPDEGGILFSVQAVNQIK